jgi:hypothetical protein
MAAGDFKILVSDLSCSVEEWRRALQVDEAELPELTEEQKQWVKRFGVGHKEYARGLLAGLYGNERQKKRARALGEEVGKILEVLGAGYAVLAVVWQGSKLRWLVRVQTPGRVLGIPVPFELADDVLDSQILREIERLRQFVLAGIGREDMVSKQA